MIRAIIVLLTALLTISCNIDDVITGQLPPEITFENNTGVFRVKQGRTIIIAPNYQYVEGAQYIWTSNGEVLSTEPALTYCNDAVGEYYITLSVSNEAGVKSVEIRIDVVELEIPFVSLPNSQNGFTIALGNELTLTPTVKETSIETEYIWSINSEVVSHSLSYTFVSETIGEFPAKFVAHNEDGADSVSFVIKVCTIEDLPVEWRFEQTTYNYSTGRSIKIAPTTLTNYENGTFGWYLNGVALQEGPLPYYICSLSEVGEYTILAVLTLENTANQGSTTLTQEIKVNVCPKEGTFYRPSNSSSLMTWDKIYEYTPAPGQFINDLKSSGFNGSEYTPEDAVSYAERRLKDKIWVSLGGFGGYIIAGFDHSVKNNGAYELAISGNSFDGSSEPGIVWVMQDENGDGLPNDTWYELKGSETGAAGTIQDYAVTYYRPAASGMAVQWSDNQGNCGQIDYLGQFHSQEYYYPLWISEESYTLRGTKLLERNYDASGNGSYWVQPHYDWGYVDNNSPIDIVGQEGTNDGSPSLNIFKISNAIDYNGESIFLDYIDFVKIQTATNTKSGWLGENSTEVTGIYDNNLRELQ